MTTGGVELSQVADKPVQLNPQTFIAAGSLAGIAAHLVMRFVLSTSASAANVPLYLVLAFGGMPLFVSLTRKLLKFNFGSDLLAGISILSAALLGEYLAGSIVVLMLSSGEALEQFAVRKASSALNALAKRMPQTAHRRVGEQVEDVPAASIEIGDSIVIFPHEISPVDGVVEEGHGGMDEAYLTGEPFEVSKTSGSEVFSGAINGEGALTIRATRRAVDSRYAKIMQVMHDAEKNRPPLRRMGERLGAIYTPLALAIAALAGFWSGDAVRFLAVLVIATPCPLLIAIPVAVMGAISLAARRGIVIKNPAILEQFGSCHTILLDKTGTLTYGKPDLTEIVPAPEFNEREVLKFAASIERYSKHPLAQPILDRARADSIDLESASSVGEKPGQGLQGVVGGRAVEITSRKKLLARFPELADALPHSEVGLECVVIIDGKFSGMLRFRDSPRRESSSFIRHLGPRHRFQSVMLVSGDREIEVQYLAKQLGLTEVYFSQTPEQKVALVERENKKGCTVFVGDGINDSPSLAAASIGIAFGTGSDVTSEAADAVVMEGDLRKVDELFHIGQRMYRIAAQSAVGGMALSVVGMLIAAAGGLSPVGGAIAQEAIDLVAVLNALRMAVPPRTLTDF